MKTLLQQLIDAVESLRSFNFKEDEIKEILRNIIINGDFYLVLEKFKTKRRAENEQ